MFMAVREGGAVADISDYQFNLHSNCALYNIFHPQDPIAYRIEPLV
jgi:hypothetical protein